VRLSPEFVPAQLMGVSIHPDNALRFDFLIQKGDSSLGTAQKRVEYGKLIKYFLASLTIPDENQWVNLSPYEKDRIIKQDFGNTEMGRDLLAEDYMLKQITSSLIYPEDRLGKKFWDKVYEMAWKEFGTTQVPINTFNKVWIIPDEAVIYEKGNTAYILRNHLKVMLEEDYLSLEKHNGITSSEAKAGNANRAHSIASGIIKQIILPELEREVNEGKNFATLRQVYSGMILATWYKHALKESLLGQVYANKSKVAGVDQNPKNNQLIYHQYLKAFKKGVFNFIREDVDKYTQQPIPRKYFAGGAYHYRGFQVNPARASAGVVADYDNLDEIPKSVIADVDGAMYSNLDQVGANLQPDAAMILGTTILGKTQLSTGAEQAPMARFYIEARRDGARRLYSRISTMPLEKRSSLFSEEGEGIDKGAAKAKQNIQQLLQSLNNQPFIRAPLIIQEFLNRTSHIDVPINFPVHIAHQNRLYMGDEQIGTVDENSKMIIEDVTPYRIDYFKIAGYLVGQLGRIEFQNTQQVVEEAIKILTDKEDMQAGTKRMEIWKIMHELGTEDNSEKQPYGLDMNTVNAIFMQELKIAPFDREIGGMVIPSNNDVFAVYDKTEQEVRNDLETAGYLTADHYLTSKIDSIDTPSELFEGFPDLDQKYFSHRREIFNTLKNHMQHDHYSWADLVKVDQSRRKYGFYEMGFFIYAAKRLKERFENRVVAATDAPTHIEQTLTEHPNYGVVTYVDADGQRHDIAYLQARMRGNEVELTPMVGGNQVQLAMADLRAVTTYSNPYEPGQVAEADRAAIAVKTFNQQAPTSSWRRGGIDLNSANLRLIIKHDGRGMTVPIDQKDMAQLSNIAGFTPQITEIKPVVPNPVLDQLQQKVQSMTGNI